MADSNEPDGKAQSTDPDELGTTGDDRVHDPVDDIAARIEHQILDEAATWENNFPAGPGQVVSVKDAARVIANELQRRADGHLMSRQPPEAGRA